MGVSPKKSSKFSNAVGSLPSFAQIFTSVLLVAIVYVYTAPPDPNWEEEERLRAQEAEEERLFEIQRRQAELIKQDVAEQNGPGNHPFFEYNNANIGDRTEKQKAFIANMDDLEKPKLAWLMSFPNSGTSYTMSTVEIMSNLSTASNYADEVTGKDEFSVSVHALHPEGPFWEGLSGAMGRIRNLPENYVLVKTHCGSRCIHCSPHRYVETLDSFGTECRNTTARVPPLRKRKIGFYPLERIKKAVHIIRNPYHNFIARFHLDRKNAQKKDRETYTNDPAGFREWCSDLDQAYVEEEFQVFEYEMAKQVQLSPCHGEVVKWVQWHNLAFQLTESMEIESHIVYYEDYTTKLNETIGGVLEYLELPSLYPPREFRARADYDKDYYTHLDKRRMRLLAERIASPKTWEMTKHYFPLFKREYEDGDGADEEEVENKFEPKTKE